MFKFLLAFLVWLFATGKYQDWVALLSSGGSSGGTSGASTSGASSILSGLGSLTGNSTTDAQLLGPNSFSPSDSGVPK